MVAYSFKAMFAGQVSALTKRHTIRGDRRRHARPGESVQLYTGMRTRECRKLVDPDPICSRVRPIAILTVLSPHLDLIGAIVIDGRSLGSEEIERFAQADGFGIEHVGDCKMRRLGVPGSARFNMGQFWEETHGTPAVFNGWLIDWEPAS